MAKTSRPTAQHQNKEEKIMINPSISNNDRAQPPQGHKKYVGRIPLFLTKTYDLVCYCDREHSDILCWTANDDAFVVKDRMRLGSNILSQYFNHSNTASFYRQLNFYCFDKTTPHSVLNADFADRRSNHVIYSHRFFKKDDPDLLPRIKRSTHSDQKNAACVKKIRKLKKDLKEAGGKWKSRMGELKRKLDLVESTMDFELDLLVSTEKKRRVEKVDSELVPKRSFVKCSSHLSDDSFRQLIANTLPPTMISVPVPDKIFNPEREISHFSDIDKFPIDPQQERLADLFEENDLPAKPTKPVRETTGKEFLLYMKSGEWEKSNRERQTSCDSLLSRIQKQEGKLSRETSELSVETLELRKKSDWSREVSMLLDEIECMPKPLSLSRGSSKSLRETTGEMFLSYMKSGEFENPVRQKSCESVLSDILRKCGKTPMEMSELFVGPSNLSRKTSDLSKKTLETSLLLEDMTCIPKPSKEVRGSSKMWGIESKDIDQKMDYGLMYKYLRTDKPINGDRSTKLHGQK